ncbi:MAG TPA: hypothetical protein VGK23_04445 [Methanomassiliicoccales archaeon]|jgi:hypothetical protein
MKSIKKNGAKRNPILALAILGLLVGAGATGALAAGLIPNLDSGVTGSVKADVTDSPLLTLTGFGGLGTTAQYQSSGADRNVVKFSGGVSILAPGNATFNMTVKVNRVADTYANGVLVKMTGLNDHTLVSLNGSATNPPLGTVAPSIVRIANGEWVVSNAGAIADTDAFALTFMVYVSQANTGDAAAFDNLWDFSFSEINTYEA